MRDEDRIRWRCRRGLLELDLVLSKFLDGPYKSLSPEQLAVFNVILSYGDNDLWDLLSHKQAAESQEIARLVELFD
jgi:antitoxin CptB